MYQIRSIKNKSCYREQHAGLPVGLAQHFHAKIFYVSLLYGLPIMSAVGTCLHDNVTYLECFNEGWRDSDTRGEFESFKEELCFLTT